FILADVVGSDTKRRREFLNQGSRDSVKSGQMVLALPHDGLTDSVDQEMDVYQMCVVGRISEVSSHNSQLRLLNDPDFRLPVIVEPAAPRGESWRADGILQGQKMGKMVITMVEVKEYPIQTGDRVLACSDPRTLPIEMIIGHVQFCLPDKDNPVLWRIVVEPLMDLHTLKLALNAEWMSIHLHQEFHFSLILI
ncbi:MAG: hypothetical protein IIB08_04375, partial [Bacteroidetes bacterium]|nr:hypothetical protein [Bacteroidota bacterium]